MYDDGSVLAAELPREIIDQPDVPGEADSMFQRDAGLSAFWDDHHASIVLDGLEGGAGLRPDPG